MRTIRIEVFHNDHLLHRFASVLGPRGRQARSFEELVRGIPPITGASQPRVDFFGSDPLEHPSFPDLVEYFREQGLTQFQIVTDGYGLASEGVRRFLHARDILDLAVVFPSANPDDYAQSMRSKRRFAAAQAGIEAAAAEGFEVNLIVPLIRSAEAHIDETLEWAAAHPLSGMLVESPGLSFSSAEGQAQLLDYTAAARLTQKIFNANRRARRTSGTHERWRIPPCAANGALDDYADLFNQRLRHYQHRDADELVPIDACATCSLNETCKGIERGYAELFPTTEFRPIPLEEANSWYTKPINRLEEITFKRYSPYQGGKENRSSLGLLRINGHCNMGCSFCFVDLSQPNVEADTLEDEIDRLAASGVTNLVLSGGEPTLHPDLPKLIAYAKTKGFKDIELQSNGVRISNRDYAESLVGAGLDIACLSLHSHIPERSDAITKRPNAFGRTVQGLHNLRELGAWTRIAHVINRMNYKDLPDFVRFVRAEWPEGMLDICFAIAQEISSHTSTWILPTFTEIKPYVREALDFCLENNISFSGLIGAGGYPPCMLDGELKYYENAYDQIYRTEGTDWYKAPRCSTCSFNDKCVGIRSAYVKIHGDSEIKPF